MKFFNWMQNKLSGSNGRKKPNSVLAEDHKLQSHCKEEFSDWPQAFLAIGTFGNNNLKDPDGKIISAKESNSSQEFPLEEGSLQEEVTICFQEQVESILDTEQEEEHNDQTNKSLSCENKALSDGQHNSNSSLIPIKGKDLSLDSSTSSGIGKKSLSFLLKKMFVCRSGFQVQPAPSFRDTLCTESRMEKMLRELLHKKIYPQVSSNSAMSGKKYLEGRQNLKPAYYENESDAITNRNGCKWVKTDSEYIVLEI